MAGIGNCICKAELARSIVKGHWKLGLDLSIAMEADVGGCRIAKQPALRGAATCQYLGDRAVHGLSKVPASSD